MDAEQIRSRLRTMNSYENASEFFGDLGYAYANDAPVPTRNWPESVQRHEVHPRYIAQHGDFKVVYCEMPGDRMLRTVQRSIIDQLAREHTFFMVVFHQTAGNVWDFVNVSVTRDSDEKRVRRIARRLAITEAERIRDRLRTTSERLVQIDINKQQNITALQVQSLHNKAFDVEQVTKDFYDQYDKVIEAFSDDIAARNSSIEQDASFEALRLLDRLMFLYFIQKKGWLNQEFDYLYARFQDHTALLDGTSYYEKVIIPLFHALANRNERIGDVGDVPFLNGGLFQFDQSSLVYRLKISNRVFQKAFDDLFERYNFTVEEDLPDDRAVAIDPEMLGKVFESLILNIEQGKDLRKATGSYYTPRTIVSFMCQQSLREYIVQRWRDSYQPQSPDAMLPMKVQGKGGQRDMRDLQIEAHEQAYQQRIVRFVEDGIPADLTPEEARQVRRWLLDVRVIDPAVGSGAFLVGMLQEIIRLVALLDEYTGDHDIFDMNYVYDLKRDIIGSCLYGVDIQASAVQICELRLWLSLIVDYEPEQTGKPFHEWIYKVETLPNLSYLVRQGNSLIEQVFGETVQLEATGLSNEIAPIIREIQKLKTDYYGETQTSQKRRMDTEILRLQASLTRMLLERKASDTRRNLVNEFGQANEMALPGLESRQSLLSRTEQRRKAELEDQIKHIEGLTQKANDIRKRAEQLRPATHGYEGEIEKLRNQLGAFIWRVDFGEVFYNDDPSRRGFDIAIANPPYIRQEKIKEYKADFQKLFPDVYDGRADLYVYFFAQSINLLRQDGTLIFITPNKYTRAGYGEGLRSYLNQFMVGILIDFGDMPVFEATTYPFITSLKKTQAMKKSVVKILNISNQADLDNLTQLIQQADELQQIHLRKDGWQLSDQRTQSLISKLRAAGNTLRDYVDNKFYMGVKTGLNDAFVIDEAIRETLLKQNPEAKEIIKPWLRGKDIKRWHISNPKLYLLFTYHGVDITKYRSVEEYLAQFKPDLLKRATITQHKWYELQQPQMGIYEEFSLPKIIYPHFSLIPNFAFDTDGFYGNDRTYVIPNASYYLLGLMNSNVSHFILQYLSPPVRGGYMELRQIYVGQIPIPDATAEQRELVEKLVQQLLVSDKKRSDIKLLERQLNIIFYEIYGLVPDEVDLIEQTLNKDAILKADSALSELTALEGDF